MSAAVRAGAVGFGGKSKLTLYSSVPLRSFRENEHCGDNRRLTIHGKGYGVKIKEDPESTYEKFKLRRKMLEQKLKLCDWSFFLALIGILLAIVDVEINALDEPYMKLSTCLRIIIVFSTFLLDALVIGYHLIEVKISLTETGHNQWSLGFSTERIFKLITELIICSICPYPGTGSVTWPLLGFHPQTTPQSVDIPVHVLLVIPMFLRLYIACRFMVLHSSMFQNTSTKTIASLNQISVDFAFVIKTQLYNRPLTIICVSTGCFWVMMAWMLTQYSRTSLSGYEYFIDYIWFEVVTFFSIGYGDVQVETYCGRGLAIITGIVGTMMSSLIIALMGRRMQLSLSERRVNQVIAESQLSIRHKHAAARVLQFAWLTSRYKRNMSTVSQAQRRNVYIDMRQEQRNLLKAVISFRKSRWKLRMRLEEEDEFIAFRRSFTETEDRLHIVRTRQVQLKNQLLLLHDHINHLTTIVASSPVYCRTPSQDTICTVGDNGHKKTM
ncbi:hypothetical protein QR680_006449 [Steinernema hermaphroditum]|uniref:Calmodulin-binding domain-containing protein n=1 Tax=Steinernema hermaphroditum TaxID=289476 RepID=A0AA39HWY0_9BILA|nr:hypothetical protein QR680_006449 [Steinernema hermaphroditum]